jgi:hypothetical protein
VGHPHGIHFQPADFEIGSLRFDRLFQNTESLRTQIRNTTTRFERALNLHEKSILPRNATSKHLRKSIVRVCTLSEKPAIENGRPTGSLSGALFGIILTPSPPTTMKSIAYPRLTALVNLKPNRGFFPDQQPDCEIAALR